MFIRLAVAQRARLADHAIHPRISWRRAGAPCMHVVLVDNGRSARLGHGAVLDLSQMHPLRRLHEHLPGLPPLRGALLRLHLFRPDRSGDRPDVRQAQVLQPAVRLHTKWQLHQRLPDQDQPARADLRLARRDGGGARGAARQEDRDAGGRPGARQPEALPPRHRHRRQRARTFAALCHLQPAQCLGKGRENPQPPRQSFHLWWAKNRAGKSGKPET